MYENEFELIETAVDQLDSTACQTLLAQIDIWQTQNFTDKQLALSIIGWIGQNAIEEPEGFTEAILTVILAINAEDDEFFEGLEAYIDEQQEDPEATPKEVAKRIIRWIADLFD